MKKFVENNDLDFRGYVVNHKEKDYDLKIKDRVKNNIDIYRENLIQAAKNKDIAMLHQTVEDMFCQLIAQKEIEIFMNNLHKGDMEENIDKYLNIYRMLYKYGFCPYMF